MAEVTAGVLLVRRRDGRLQVLLGHPGGPFHARKDDGDWSLPKGLPEPDDRDLLATARREFAEETGRPLDEAVELVPLGTVTQKSGKVVHAWACLGDCDAGSLASNTFELEWPPRSGRVQAFPEVDRFEWFDVDAARRKILPAQAPLLDRVEAAFGEPR